MRIQVVVASATGRTRRMAEAFAAGAREVGAEVALGSADEVDEQALIDADAIALGSGVHMGGISAPMRRGTWTASSTWHWLAGPIMKQGWSRLSGLLCRAAGASRGSAKRRSTY